MSVRSYIVDDREKKTFLLDREVLVSEDVLRKEMAQIFGRCWIYVGHSSELKKSGDFRSRRVAGRPMIFCRDQAGKFHCLFNTCRHRGAIVCTEREGNRRRFQCIYHGWTYGSRVADTNRNLVIFPNLVINDGSSVTVRTFYPEGVGKMHVTAWALGPVEEGASARARRLDAFLTFYGPGGFATPDDVEALELVQQGLANWSEDRWSEMSRGMGKEGEQLNSDEHHLRIFWRRWNELMGAAQ